MSLRKPAAARFDGLDEVFERSRFDILDTAVARLGVFGAALELLGPIGIRVARQLADTDSAQKLSARIGRPQASLRRPEARSADRPDGVSFDLPPKALARWDVGVEAKAGDNVITILEPIGEDFFGGGVTAKRITAALRSIGDKPVTVQINSPGGDFFEGLAIYNALAQHPNEINVEVIGLAASAASFIAMAGDSIAIAKAGMMMIHNTQWVAIGDRHMMTDTADIMAKFDAVLAGIYTDRTGLDDKAVGKIMDAETWLTGPEAVDKGFATELMAVDPAKTDTKQKAFFAVDAAMARAGVPRAERRKLMKDLGTPGAVQDDPMPGAGDAVAEALKGVFTSL